MVCLCSGRKSEFSLPGKEEKEVPSTPSPTLLSNDEIRLIPSPLLMPVGASRASHMSLESQTGCPDEAPPPTPTHTPCALSPTLCTSSLVRPFTVMNASKRILSPALQVLIQLRIRRMRVQRAASPNKDKFPHRPGGRHLPASARPGLPTTHTPFQRNHFMAIACAWVTVAPQDSPVSIFSCFDQSPPPISGPLTFGESQSLEHHVGGFLSHF